MTTPTPPTHGPTCIGIDNGCPDCKALEAHSPYPSTQVRASTHRHPGPAQIAEWRSEADRWIRLATDESERAQYPDGFVAPFDSPQSPAALRTTCIRLLDTIEEIELLRAELLRGDLTNRGAVDESESSLSERITDVQRNISALASALADLAERVGAPHHESFAAALEPLIRAAGAESGGVVQLPPIVDMRPTPAEVERWKAHAEHVPGPLGRTLQILLAEVQRLGAEGERQRRLLRRVACYAVVDPLGNPAAACLPRRVRMLALECDIDDCLEGRPERD